MKHLGFLILLALLLAMVCTVLADLKMEVKQAPGGPSPVLLRITGGATNTLYWIERSDDQGKTWEEYIRVKDGDWWYISVKPTNSLFRAKVIPE